MFVLLYPPYRLTLVGEAAQAPRLRGQVKRDQRENTDMSRHSRYIQTVQYIGPRPCCRDAARATDYGNILKILYEASYSYSVYPYVRASNYVTLIPTFLPHLSIAVSFSLVA